MKSHSFGLCLVRQCISRVVITPEFVFVHLPKTGGTFVQSMLFRVHELRRRSLQAFTLGRFVGRLYQSRFGDALIKTYVSSMLDRIAGDSLIVFGHKHSPCRAIPTAQRHKTMLSIIRNPYNRYVSIYEFRDWQRVPERYGGLPLIQARFPRFPDLSFAEYMELHDHFDWRASTTPFMNHSADPQRFGTLAVQFVGFFFKDPVQSMRKVNSEYISSRTYMQDMFPIHFLRTENLNQDLYDFLLGIGYDRQAISTVLKSPKVLPRNIGRGDNQEWQSYYTPELKRKVRQKDALLFDLFPEYDV